LGHIATKKWEIYNGVRVIVFNATFNNISVISWRSVLVEISRKSLTNFITKCCIE